MAQITNPVLKDLGVLSGWWDVALAFSADPSNIARAHVSFEWLEGGAFLLMRLPADADGPTKSLWLMGRDDSGESYTVLYFDLRGVSRVYQMSLAHGEWKMWRDAPGFSQRYSGTLSPDHNTITARWEKSTDGTHWEHDFDMTYTRIAPDK